MKDVPEKKPTNDRQTGPAAPSSRTGGLSPHSVQRLQGAAGNAAVARLVAQRYTAPVKTPANAAPGFRRVGADVAAKKRTMAAHAPAAAESKSAQDAAVAPPDDKEAQGKAANAEKMNAAKPGEFDKAAFVAAVDKAIEAQAPKNLDEADKFSKSGKADKVKDEVDGKVGEGKDTSAEDIATTTKAPPDTSAAKDKPVTPLDPDRPPPNPGAPSASDAIPEKQPPAVTDFSQGPAENDKAMADAEVTEEQLAKGNEPEFDEALKAKKTAEADSAKAPGKAHTAEDRQLSTAKAGAAASGAQAMNTLTATRAAAGQAVDGGKGETKSKDEQKRAEVTAKLQKVFDATKKDVEATLTGLDQKVDTAFTSGEKSARDAFTADHKARMKKYKDKRYGGLMGKGRWLKDKFAGLPKEANDLYQESRKLYVARMRTVISSVADLIGAELGRAKARIAQGRTELRAEVDKLPADLKAFGEEARQDFAGKFEDLEASVDEKSQQLVQDLANKYTAALNAVDEEIKKLQEANKGLIDKAKDAIVGVIKTINELKNLLLGILAKAASAIVKIIKDPIGFLGNLVRAVGAGLNLFVTNIGTHLKTGLVSWLLGTATKAGLELPQRFDLRGITQLIASLLGLTWDNIRTRITRKGVPEEAMSAVESTVPVAQSLAREGPAGAVKEIQAETGDLKSTILSKLTEYLVPTVIIAGVTWILSLLNPASAFVRAVKGIIDIVTFVVTQGAQIADFVNAVLDAVIQIANGGAAGVPKMVETALAASIPLLIGFLAALLGIGNLANKVKSVFQAVSKPVNRAIDKIVDFIATKGKALWQKLKGKESGNTWRPDTSAESHKRKERELPTALSKARRIVELAEKEGKTPQRLLGALLGLRRKYSWIRNFRLEGAAPVSVVMIASHHPVSNFESLPPDDQVERLTVVRQAAKDAVASLAGTRRDGRVHIALAADVSLLARVDERIKRIRRIIDGRGALERDYGRALNRESTNRPMPELGRAYAECRQEAKDLEEELQDLKNKTPPKVGDSIEVRSGVSWVASTVVTVTETTFTYQAMSGYGRTDSGTMRIGNPGWREFDPGRHYKKGPAWERIKSQDEWSNYPDARQVLNYRHHKRYDNPTGMEWHHIHEQYANGPNSVKNLTLSTVKQNASFNHWFNKPQKSGPVHTQGIKLREYLRVIGASAADHRYWGDVCLAKHGLRVEEVDRGRGPYQVLVAV
ncbi:hypothetical protein [Streptomyces sp. NPDC056049]|uniref:phage tail protein n=1 Tax=Streptomyces sp. NPDC056049 TaxID=3345693 RepID=UPI0035DC854F